MTDWRPAVITVDGPAASGKGTLARRLADHFGYAHLDTGKLYRAVAQAVLEGGGDPADETAAAQAARSLPAARLADGVLDDPELASDRIGNAASLVARIPAVRDALFDLQRNFAGNPPNGAAGAVLDGRDTGTVICPDAEMKFFVIASAEVRAERRHKELQERGEKPIYSGVLADIIDRDRRDSTRAVAPAKPAEDAVEIDTSDLDADAALAAALEHIRARGAQRP